MRQSVTDDLSENRRGAWQSLNWPTRISTQSAMLACCRPDVGRRASQANSRLPPSSELHVLNASTSLLNVCAMSQCECLCIIVRPVCAAPFATKRSVCDMPVPHRSAELGQYPVRRCTDARPMRSRWEPAGRNGWCQKPVSRSDEPIYSASPQDYGVYAAFACVRDLGPWYVACWTITRASSGEMAGTCSMSRAIATPTGDLASGVSTRLKYCSNVSIALFLPISLSETDLTRAALPDGSHNDARSRRCSALPSASNLARIQVIGSHCLRTTAPSTSNDHGFADARSVRRSLPQAKCRWCLRGSCGLFPFPQSSPILNQHSVFLSWFMAH